MATKKPGGSWSMRTPITLTPAGRRSKARFHSGIILWHCGQPLRKNSRIVVEPFGKSTYSEVPLTRSATNAGMTSPGEGRGTGAAAGWAAAPAPGGPRTARPQQVSFPKGSKTILLFFLSGCPTCHKMIPEWNRAYERRAKDLKVMGVIMDQEPPGFWSTMPIAFPVLRSPGRQFLTSLNVNRAPLTVRVTAGGRIEDVGLGLLDPIRLGEIFRP